MDPISITTFVMGATKFTWTIAFALREAKLKFAAVDEHVEALSREIHGLRALLISITTTLNEPALGLAELDGSTEREANKDMWSAVAEAVQNCHDYLEKLCLQMKAFEGSGERKSSLAQAVRAFKLQLDLKEINQIRSHIQAHHISLNTSLHTPTVYLVCKLPVQMQRPLERKVDLLGKMIEQLQASINDRHPRLEAQSDSPKTESDSPSISSSQRLKEAACRIHANASVTSAARSTICSGSEQNSVLGEPLSDGSRREIERWIGRQCNDSFCEQPAYSGPLSELGSSSSDHADVRDKPASHSSKTNPDVELVDWIESSVRRGRESLENKDFSGAVALYEHALALYSRLKTLRLDELRFRQIRLQLAWLFTLLADFEKSICLLEIILELESANEALDDAAWEAVSLLAWSLSFVKDYAEAENICHQALRWWSMDPELAPQYSNMLRLSALIYVAKGESDKSLKASDMLPSSKQFRPEEFTFLLGALVQSKPWESTDYLAWGDILFRKSKTGYTWRLPSTVLERPLLDRAENPGKEWTDLMINSENRILQYTTRPEQDLFGASCGAPEAPALSHSVNSRTLDRRLKGRARISG